MSILKFSFFIIITTSLIFQSCSRLDDSGIGCSKVDSVYYRLDSMAKSLVKVYHAGDTLKLKDSTGVIYYFIAQKPDSGFYYEKDPGSIYSNCPGNDWFLGHYNIQLNNTNSNLGAIKIRVYYSSNLYRSFEIEFQESTYWDSWESYPLPPSTEYIDSIVVGKYVFRNVGKMRNKGETLNYSLIYYNRTDGLVRIISPDRKVYDKVP